MHEIFQAVTAHSSFHQGKHMPLLGAKLPGFLLRRIDRGQNDCCMTKSKDRYGEMCH